MSEKIAVIAWGDISAVGLRVLFHLASNNKSSVETIGNGDIILPASVKPLLVSKENTGSEVLQVHSLLPNCQLYTINAALASEHIVAAADAIIQHIVASKADRVVLVGAVNFTSPPHLAAAADKVVVWGDVPGHAADSLTQVTAQMPGNVELSDEVLSTLLHLARVAALPSLALLTHAKRSKNLASTAAECERLFQVVARVTGASDAKLTSETTWGEGWEVGSGRGDNEADDNMLYR